MADQNADVAAPRPWMELADEATLMSKADRIAAFKAAFEANFKDVDINKPAAVGAEREYLVNNGLVDPGKCTVAGAGVYGGYAGSPISFVVTGKDSGGRNIPNCGGQIVVKVVPVVRGVGGFDMYGDIYGDVIDKDDGTYSVTYLVPKRGYYMVHVKCNGFAITGSPFPVFFGGGSFSGLVSDPPEGVLLPGVEPICREFLHGRCFKTDCNLEHPTHELLMTAIEKASGSGSGTMSRVPMAPSAASLAAAQAILAAQARQAHAAQKAQSLSSKDSTGASEKDKAEMLKRIVHVSNFVPNITANHLTQLFGVRGTVLECTIITDAERFAYIEYAKPEQAIAALALNNRKVCDRPLRVEMAESLPPKPAISTLNSQGAITN